MELDELKVIWNQVEHVTDVKITEPVTTKLPRQVKDDIFYRMRKNLRTELIIVLVSVTLVSVYYFMAYGGRLKEVSWLYIFLAAAFVGYYYKKASLLRSMECVACKVKSNLRLQLTTLEKWVRLYQLAGIALVPLIMLFFYVLLSYHHFVIQIPFAADISQKSFAAVYLVFTVIFTTGLYFFNRWWVYKLYGRHIKKLKSLVAEMEEE